MTELRRSVMFCLSRGSTFTLQDVVGLSPTIAKSAVVRYLGSLVNLEVLVLHGIQYGPGQEAEEWRRKIPKTRAGGNAKAYVLARKTRDQVATRAFQQVRQGGVLTCQNETGPDRFRHIPSRDDIMREVLELGRVCTMRELAVILRVSRKTVERRLMKGDIQGIKVGRLWRIFASEIKNYMRPRLTAKQEKQACQ